MRNHKCLLVASDLTLAEPLEQNLQAAEMQVSVVPDLDTADLCAHAHRYAACVLQTAADGPSPLEPIVAIREHDPVISLFVILEQWELDVERMLLLGGCNDVFAPSMPAETIAMRVAVRTLCRPWSLGGKPIIELNGIRIDFNQMRIGPPGKMKPLTPGLGRLLQFFIGHANEIVSAELLCRTLWYDHAVDAGGKNLAMHVGKLRKLLRDPAGRNRCVIRTVRGLGYRLVIPPGALNIIQPGGRAHPAPSPKPRTVPSLTVPPARRRPAVSR